LYKGLAGAESCGCFGSVHVNPWITLFAIDLPAVAALATFRPKGEKFFVRPSLGRFAAPACLGLLTLGVTAPLLAFHEPAVATSSYEVLEPETWVGQELPILGHIDIANELEQGRWVVLLYHYDCPDCAEAVPQYEQMARDLADNRDFLRIALIEVPPYGPSLVNADSPCTSGKLAEAKEWFVTTPAVVVLENGRVRSAWEGRAPDLDAVFGRLAALTEFGSDDESI
ncbi:MAG: hypothetical protein ACYS29_15555, partial [Planctomycetota bacterium]